MNLYRAHSVGNISKKFFTIVKENCISKSVSEMIEFMDTQHPITVLNFYTTMLRNTCEDGKEQFEYAKNILSSYMNDQINFDDLREHSKCALAALYHVFNENDRLDEIFFTEENILNAEVKTLHVE